MPLQLAAAGDERRPQRDCLHEPLTAGHDFERAIAFLVELDVVDDWFRGADEVAGCGQLLDDPRPGLHRGQAGQFAVVLLRARRINRLPAGCSPRHRPQRAAGAHDGAHRQFQLAPPRHVGEIAKRADHGDAAPLIGVGERMRSTGTRAPNRGVITSRPIKPRYRSSSGCATRATQAGISSGRVVSMSTGPPPGRVKRTVWKAPGTSRSSSSAWATAVLKSMSQSVGASS